MVKPPLSSGCGVQPETERPTAMINTISKDALNGKERPISVQLFKVREDSVEERVGGTETLLDKTNKILAFLRR